MIKNNPFLKVEEKLIRIYGNVAKIIFVERENSYNSATGEIEKRFTEVEKEIYISDTHVFSEATGNGNYFVGDITFSVSRQELLSIIPNGRNSSTAMCGLMKDSDEFELYGERYRIVSIKPKTVWAGVPAVLRIQVRSTKERINGTV